MKTLYLDCQMGAAGDMLTAALIELFPDPEEMLHRLNAIGIPGVKYIKEKAVKCGITGTHMRVLVNGEEETVIDSGNAHDHGHEHCHKHENEHQDHEHHSHDQETHEHERETHDHEHVHDHDYEHEHHGEHGHNCDHDHHHGDHDHHHDQHGHHGHHTHSSLSDIENIVKNINVSKKVKHDILGVYSLIAEAESHVHGVPVTQIHFHEVGNMDAVADITAVCFLMDKISPDEVVVSPIHVGSGHVHCAHGILPVPAPATAYILQGIPVYSGNIKGELCTPTGAALLKYFASRFDSMPVIKVDAIGYGMGKKDFEMANCVRAMKGESSDRTDVVLELSCNVDDMTGEAVSFAMDRLFEAGAKEVYTIPVGMKKSRPGLIIRAMCAEQDKESVIAALFKYTTTIGVREAVTRRYILDRQIKTKDTAYGPVRYKRSTGYGVERIKYEFDDLSRIADSEKMTLDEVKNLIS